MSLNPLLYLPFKSLAASTTISSPQNCSCLSALSSPSRGSQLHQFTSFFSFQLTDPLARWKTMRCSLLTLKMKVKTLT
ncbi:hypothetical protein ACB092_09G038200 [Castanea dentata]